MSPIILKVRFNKNNFLSFTNLITKYKIFIFQFLTMRKRYIHTSSTKDSQDFQFHNHFFHNLQPTQNQYLDVQNTDEDFMDFQYDDDKLNNSQSEEIEEFSENNNDNDKSEYEETDEETGEETDEETDKEINEETNKETDEEPDEETDEETDKETDEETDEEDGDDDKIEDKLSDEEEFENIIDKALDENKMTSYNNDNEFAPYFENFTTASLFCWIQKHNITTRAYEDLAEIIHSSQFVSTHVVKNIRRFRKWRQHLPILPIFEKSVSISSKKTPSTSKDLKMSYQLSINDIIWHVLNNPSLIKHMYFGPGIDSEIKSEYWHGTLWGESPFFGKEKITISRG